MAKKRSSWRVVDENVILWLFLSVMEILFVTEPLLTEVLQAARWLLSRLSIPKVQNLLSFRFLFRFLSEILSQKLGNFLFLKKQQELWVYCLCPLTSWQPQYIPSQTTYWSEQWNEGTLLNSPLHKNMPRGQWLMKPVKFRSSIPTRFSILETHLRLKKQN